MFSPFVDLYFLSPKLRNDLVTLCKYKITQHQMLYISFLFYFGKILRCFPVIKMTGSVHTTFLLNTTQSQWSEVPNTYMHTYILTYIHYLPNKNDPT